MKDDLYNRIAISHGYDNIKEMLIDLYSTQGISQGMMANLIGCSLPTIKTLRAQYDIKDRPKKLIEKLGIPLKELKKRSCNELATKYKMSKSYIWRLKQAAKTTAGRSRLSDEEV